MQKPHIKHPHQVAEAVRLAREARPDLPLEGPIQYDAAVDPVVAKQKVKGESAVAGRANVCIFPDLNTGNNTYKASPNPNPTQGVLPYSTLIPAPRAHFHSRCTWAQQLPSTDATERCERHAELQACATALSRAQQLNDNMQGFVCTVQTEA